MHNSDKCGVEVTGPHRSKNFIEISAVNSDELFVINFNYLFLLLHFHIILSPTSFTSHYYLKIYTS